MDRTVICIDGLIGAGKSSCLEKLKMVNSSIPVKFEPTSTWTMLEQFYEQKPNAGYAFELEVAVSRCTQMFDTLPDHPKVVFERNPIYQTIVFGQLSLDCKVISEMQYHNLSNFAFATKKMLEEAYSVEFINVYIECPLEVCLERIKERNRKGEESITLDYLSQLEEKYFQFAEFDYTVSSKDMTPMEVACDVNTYLQSLR